MDQKTVSSTDQKTFVFQKKIEADKDHKPHGAPCAMSIDEPDVDRTVKLVKKNTKSGKSFNILMRDLSLSKTCTTALAEDTGAKELELDCDDDVLEVIVEYLQQHQGKPVPKLDKPLVSRDISQIAKSPWDAQLIKRLWPSNKALLYKVLHSANHLMIDPLLELASACVAINIMGHPVSELNAILKP